MSTHYLLMTATSIAWERSHEYLLKSLYHLLMSTHYLLMTSISTIHVLGTSAMSMSESTDYLLTTAMSIAGERRQWRESKGSCSAGAAAQEAE